MRLILTYYATQLDKSGAQAHFPIEAPSVEDARAILREAVSQAVTLRQRDFKAFGFSHYTHNFVAEVTRYQHARVAAHYRAKNKTAPAVIEAQDRLYRHLGFKLLTVDEWFAQAQEAA